MKMVCIPAIVSLCGFAHLPAEDAVDYSESVKPILATKCFACHGALKQESELRLDAASLIQRGGDSGPAIVAGDAGASLLFQRVSTKEEDQRMPPVGEGEALTPAQLTTIKAWIDQGAVSPDEPIPPDPRDHWAFRLPLRASLPQNIDAAWSRNPIDSLIAFCCQALILYIILHDLGLLHFIPASRFIASAISQSSQVNPSSSRPK